MDSSAPADDDDDNNYTGVIKIDLTVYQHTGTYYKPSGPEYTFPSPDKFLKLLSGHFNTTVAANPTTLGQEFHKHKGAQVEFTKLPNGYTVVNRKRDNDTLDLEIYGHFLAGDRHFNLAPQFLKHVFDIMRLGQTDWLELRPEFLQQPDDLECQCALCVKPSAKRDKIQQKVDREVKNRSLRHTGP